MVFVGIGVLSIIIPTSFVYLSVLGIFFIGLGIGPIYPNISFLTPRHFGEKSSQKAMGIQMAGAFIGILLAPTLMGVLSNFLGLKIFPVFNAVLLALLVVSYAIYLRIYSKNEQIF